MIFDEKLNWPVLSGKTAIDDRQNSGVCYLVFQPPKDACASPGQRHELADVEVSVGHGHVIKLFHSTIHAREGGRMLRAFRRPVCALLTTVRAQGHRRSVSDRVDLWGGVTAPLLATLCGVTAPLTAPLLRLSSVPSTIGWVFEMAVALAWTTGERLVDVKTDPLLAVLCVAYPPIPAPIFPSRVAPRRGCGAGGRFSTGMMVRLVAGTCVRAYES